MTETKRNILVIGGSRGIGAAIVRRFAAAGDGVAFTFAGSSEAAAALQKGTGATAIHSDASDREAIIAVVKSRVALDILVINAGAFLMGNPLELDPDAVDRMIDLNVRTPYHAAVEAGRMMNDGGRIVVIGSVNGDRMPFQGASAYALTKSAMQGMVRGLARDFGERGITVNVVQPGPTDTDMNPKDGPMSGFMHSFMAIKRHVRPEEIAGMVTWLAGPDAGAVTGAFHTIDGGFGA